MKNWIRIILVCFALVGGTAFFAYQLLILNKFNNTLDNLSASIFAIANTPPIPFSDKTNKEQIPTPTPEIIGASATSTDKEQISTTTPGIIGTSATSTDLGLSFIFPQKGSEVYIGCTYQLSLQSSTTMRSLETALVDADTREIVEPIESGLAKENKIELNSQGLDWKVGVVGPGEYYIKVSNINDVDLETKSKIFLISKIPKSASPDEREKICKESDGSF